MLVLPSMAGMQQSRDDEEVQGGGCSQQATSACSVVANDQFGRVHLRAQTNVPPHIPKMELPLRVLSPPGEMPGNSVLCEKSADVAVCKNCADVVEEDARGPPILHIDWNRAADDTDKTSSGSSVRSGTSTPPTSIGACSRPGSPTRGQALVKSTGPRTFPISDHMCIAMCGACYRLGDTCADCLEDGGDHSRIRLVHGDSNTDRDKHDLEEIDDLTGQFKAWVGCGLFGDILTRLADAGLLYIPEVQQEDQVDKTIGNGGSRGRRASWVADCEKDKDEYRGWRQRSNSLQPSVLQGMRIDTNAVESKEAPAVQATPLELRVEATKFKREIRAEGVQPQPSPQLEPILQPWQKGVAEKLRDMGPNGLPLGPWHPHMNRWKKYWGLCASSREEQERIERQARDAAVPVMPTAVVPAPTTADSTTPASRTAVLNEPAPTAPASAQVPAASKFSYSHLAQGNSATDGAQRASRSSATASPVQKGSAKSNPSSSAATAQPASAISRPMSTLNAVQRAHASTTPPPTNEGADVPPAIGRKSRPSRKQRSKEKRE